MTDLKQLKRDLKPTLELVPTGRTDVPTLSIKEARKDLILPSRATRLLAAKSTEGEDRSARLYELASLLRDAGAEDDARFVLIRGSIWNKFSGRDDEVERLWEAVERSGVQSPNGHGRRDPARPRHARTRAQRVDKLLARELPPSEYSVDRIWEHGGWGFIAGEPKTYKSTFTCDLAVSIATSTPFLGNFDVLKPGPVLIVQEENTENIQWARLSRILRERDLGGKLHSVGIDEGIVEVTMPQSPGELYCLDRDRFSFGSKKKRLALEKDIAAIQPVLVVFDPLQRMLGDLRIRNEQDMTKVLDYLDSLVQTYKTGVLCVHHYHKRREDGPMEGGQRMLGSQALHAWLSCGLYVSRVEGGRLRVQREFRAFPDGTPFELEFQSEDEQDFYHVEVFGDRSTKRDELYNLVSDRPGLSVKQLAKKLGVADRVMRTRVDKHPNLMTKSAARVGKKGGRPSTVVFVRE